MDRMSLADSRTAIFDQKKPALRGNSIPAWVLAANLGLRNMQYVKLLLAFTILTVTLATVVFYAFPVRVWLVGEDNLVENLSVAFYVLAFLAIVYRLAVDGYAFPERLCLASVGMLAILGALEELSYGQRLTEFAVPVVAGVEFDALHDIAQVALNILSEGIRTGSVATILWLAGAVILLAWCVARFGRTYLLTARKSEPLLIFSIFVALIAVAIFIDLEVITYKLHLLRVYEEVFEMAAAFAVLMMALVDPGSESELTPTKRDFSGVRQPL